MRNDKHLSEREIKIDRLGVRQRDAIRLTAISVIFGFLFSFAIPSFAAPRKADWNGSSEEKLWGLMTIWAQTKFSFPHIERLKTLGWDERVQSFIPRILEARDIETYYRELAELTAALEDSHTEVIPPWGRFTPGYDNPQIEVRVIDDRFYIVGIGDVAEISSQGILPGMEILSVGAGIPIGDYFRDSVLAFHSRGSKRANEALLPFYLFYGPKGEKLALRLRRKDGTILMVELTRDSAQRDGSPFMYTFVKHSFAAAIETRSLPGGLVYVNIPNFQSENSSIRTGFLALIDRLDYSVVNGFVIDLRNNLGGAYEVLQPIVASLIGASVKAPTNRYFSYTAAQIPKGSDPITWSASDWEIAPRKGKRYFGPLAILIGPLTHSSAEDMVIELSQTGRCLTIGEATSGGAGGSLTFPLPGGGSYQVSSFKATWPDGREYMSTGLVPDIYSAPTLDDILAGKDIVLERAIQVLADPKKQ